MGGLGWGRVDGSESVLTIREAFSSGVRHFDTAGFYGKGESERIIKKALGRHRKEIFISSKAGLLWKGNRVIHDARPETIEKELEKSLERLGTDYIDLFQLHWPDPDVPVSESIDALKRLEKKGLARNWGAGNLTAEEIKHFIDNHAQVPIQTRFNPLYRKSASVLAAGHEHQRAVNCIISPLEQGLLGTGKGRHGSANLGKKDHRQRNPLFSDKTAIKNATKFRKLCDKQGCSPVTATLLWILSYKHADIIIPGPKNRRQLKETLEHTNLLTRHNVTHASTSGFKVACRQLLLGLAGYDIAALLDNADR
jgi:aryl-alcohol dehydrogenase-like predicted oxidoreductase